ncbi:TIGR04104 family putative zinc finger protein [Oceanobacillus manasiensis]|uniref:TIGR04104 family putative zinc finger protein n=1 Tax=Oceanobacillus manasiensis TaxID=586413 RepID=UPI0005A70318
MQKCEKCFTKFKWKQIYKAHMKKQPITCKECDTEHVLETSSKTVLLIIEIPIIIFIFILINKLLYTSFGNYSFALLILIGIPSLLFPFFARLKSKYRTNYKSD